MSTPWDTNPQNPRFRPPNRNPANYPPVSNPQFPPIWFSPASLPLIITSTNFSGVHRPPKVPRYNNNNSYNYQANIQHQTSFVAPTEKVPDRPQQQPEVWTGIRPTQPEVKMITIPTPGPTFNPTAEASNFIAILKQLISQDGLNKADYLWTFEVKKLITIVKNAADNQPFYEAIRDILRNMDKFKILQVWAAMFLIDPEVCLKHKTLKENILLRLCNAHLQSIASTVTAQKITEYVTARAYLKGLMPAKIIPSNSNLETPYALRILRDLKNFTSLDISNQYIDTETRKPCIFTIRREAGFFKSNMTNGIQVLLEIVAKLLWTREDDIDTEMQAYFKIESIVREFSETSNSRFEFVDCLLHERFDLEKNGSQKILVLKRKLWAISTILNCLDTRGTNFHNHDLPGSTLTTLNKLFQSSFDSGMLKSKDFYEFVAIRQHLSLNRFHQMSHIDAFMDRKCGIEYSWSQCVNNMPMKSRKDFVTAPTVLPVNNPHHPHKVHGDGSSKHSKKCDEGEPTALPAQHSYAIPSALMSKPKNLMDLTLDVITTPSKQNQPVVKPTNVIDLTSNDKEVSSTHSKKNEEAAVAKVNKFMDIIDSIIKPYAASRDDELWMDKLSVFRNMISNPKQDPNFIDDLRNRCKHSKLDPIAMLRIWIALFPTDSNDPLNRKAHTRDVMLQILAKAYLNAVDETGRKRLGELLIIRKHLMAALPSDALSKGDMDLVKKPYVQRLIADNPSFIFKTTNVTADDILEIINPYQKIPRVSTLPITELLKQKLTKTTLAEGIDKLLDEAKLLLQTKENDVITQMKSFSKIVRIMNKHSTSKEFDIEFIDCLLTEPFRKSKGTLHGRLLLWAVCALLNYAHIPNEKQDLPEITVLYLSRHFKSSFVEEKDWLEFVAIRQHLGRNRSHQMSKIDKYADEMCRSKFNWKNRVDTSRRLSREDFVVPENFMCHPKLAYTFYVNNRESRNTSKQSQSTANDKVYDSDCESETGSVEILSDVEKPSAPIVDLFSSDEEEDNAPSKPVDWKRVEFETTLKIKTENESATKSNQVNEQSQDNLSDDHSTGEQQTQTTSKAFHTSNDLNPVNEQTQNNTSDDLSKTREQETTTNALHESTCKINKSCKEYKTRQSTCNSASLKSSKAASSKRIIECTCSEEFIKANRPSTVSENKPEDQIMEEVSPIVDQLMETSENDLPAIGIPYEVLNAEEFGNYIWDNNLVKLVEEPVALEIEKEIANLLSLPLQPSINVQEQQNI